MYKVWKTTEDKVRELEAVAKRYQEEAQRYKQYLMDMPWNEDLRANYQCSMDSLRNTRKDIAKLIAVQ